ncbi:MAG: ribonuclease P protein component [Candidatus Sericytochromatia bacterium]|uniref:Ribonuclease P protein component n=1 Tax=Candidatus Tanganyikabacteria bacterium TaxID=2961651 RepID=A0A937X671_9BACT|nr:ribonuclease P protein component [Candidatus Tanganyikabacteria bacterium]
MDAASSRRVAPKVASAWLAKPGRRPVLPAEERLKSSRAFGRIYAEGATTPEQFVVLHTLPIADQPDTRLIGFAVSRKIGNAVVRNAIRRRLREIVRGRLSLMAHGYLAILAARPSARRATFSELEASVTRALGKGRLLRES